MSDLLLDAINIVALNGYVQNIAKIRETCKEASQLEILNERFYAEWDECYIAYVGATCIIMKWWRKIPNLCHQQHGGLKRKLGRKCHECFDEYYRDRYEPGGWDSY